MANTGEPEPEMVLGTGAFALEPLESGDPIDVYMGVQGGIHIFAAVRVRGLEPGVPDLPRDDPAQPVLRFGITRGEDTVSELTLRERLTPSDADDGTHELLAIRLELFLPEAEVPTAASVAAGQTLELEASVTDRDGRVARSNVTLLAREGLVP